MAVALRTGIPHDVWLEDTRALATAVMLFDEYERAARRRR